MKLIYKETRFNYLRGKDETKWYVHPVLSIGSIILVFILTIVLCNIALGTTSPTYELVP